MSRPEHEQALHELEQKIRLENAEKHVHIMQREEAFIAEIEALRDALAEENK